MEKKKIDNTIKTTKQKINEIDNKLSAEKKKIKRIDEMQESIYELNKNMNKCIELLTKSIKGETTNAVFSNMEEYNRRFYIKSTTALEDEAQDSMNRIHKLYKEKNDEIEKSKTEKE